MKRNLLIGIGNPDRGDDAIGLEIARHFRQLALPNLTVLESTGDATDLMESWQDADLVIAVDAAVGIGAPGAVHRFDARAAPLPAHLFATSTHSFGLPQAIELSRTLGKLPRQLIVYAIEGRGFDFATAPTSEVRAGGRRAIRCVLDLLQSQKMQMCRSLR